MANQSYPEALAADRDKYLKQRNKLMRVLRPILSAYEGERPNHDAPILKDARKALKEIERQTTVPLVALQ